MDSKLRNALAKVDAYIAAHPEYSREDLDLPGQGSTNNVIFAKRRGELVVFKEFCEEERRARECFGMRHWKSTGLVPNLIQEIDATLVVMSHIPGIYLSQVQEREGRDAWRSSCREFGRAIASLMNVPMTAAGRAAFESAYYGEHPTLEAYLNRIVQLGRSIQSRDPDFRDPFWKENLDFIETQLKPIFAQPRVLYDQDVMNFHVQGGRFKGFFDLEMCRVGCAAMQLGSASFLAEDSDEGWNLLVEGWEAENGASLSPADLRAAAAARHLLCWREISRYMSYDGTPGTGYDWASPANPARYRKHMEIAMRRLGQD